MDGRCVTCKPMVMLSRPRLSNNVMGHGWRAALQTAVGVHHAAVGVPVDAMMSMPAGSEEGSGPGWAYGCSSRVLQPGQCQHQRFDRPGLVTALTPVSLKPHSSPCP